jgi:hypothetical protein
MFSPDQRTLGGAVLVQRQALAMQAFIERARAEPSRYSASTMAPPRHKPEAPHFLTANLTSFNPRFGDRRRKLRGVASRIANDTPPSFAYALESRRAESAAKQRSREAEEARAAAAAAAAVASLVRPDGSTTPTPRPRSALQRRARADALAALSEEHARIVLAGRPEWDPTTTPEIIESHGLRSLLSEAPRSAMPTTAKSGPTWSGAMAAATPRAGATAAADATAYSADGVARFVPIVDADARNVERLLRAEFSRGATAAGGASGATTPRPPHRPASARAARSSPTRQGPGAAAVASPVPGALVRDAARRILQRFDSMGDRVSAATRANVQRHAAQLLSFGPAPAATTSTTAAAAELEAAAGFYATPPVPAAAVRAPLTFQAVPTSSGAAAVGVATTTASVPPERGSAPTSLSPETPPQPPAPDSPLAAPSTSPTRGAQGGASDGGAPPRAAAGNAASSRRPGAVAFEYNEPEEDDERDGAANDHPGSHRAGASTRPPTAAASTTSSLAASTTTEPPPQTTGAASPTGRRGSAPVTSTPVPLTPPMLPAPSPVPSPPQRRSLKSSTPPTSELPPAEAAADAVAMPAPQLRVQAPTRFALG